MRVGFFLLLAQCIFSAKDVIGRQLVRGHNFNLHLFYKPMFYVYILLQVVAISLQLYVLSVYTLSRAMTAFAMISIVFSVILGWLILGESISLKMYFSLVLAFASLLLLVIVVK